ncbi:tetratricopeptide repeat protein [Kitasatospora sp. NA04385]|uniref:AfsR/SARP family transcriptional regulator n=1 Tax=Kitasatospora sp. NA04385 TaxID=2742135 RepID=UPI0015915DC4|nr:BTAD domain-containing putative transcriptional regulator [Kitasatospora sp. NA04385]QKW20264.1 tetratricopeptide repeat protein [Kitasatospora sp. NA04385]
MEILRGNSTKTGNAAESDGSAARWRFRLLGPLEVTSDDRQRKHLGGAKNEKVLAVLLLESGRVVPTDRLTTALWEEFPPRTATHQVRKAIGDLRLRIPKSVAQICTEGPGYRLQLGAAWVDLHEFRQEIELARQTDPQDSAAVTGHLRAALALWRGDALAGTGGRIIETAATALEESRLAAYEWLSTVQANPDEAATLVSELRALVDRNPLRESLRHALMLALYRSGRQAEALAEYNRARELLADELGIDPGAALAQLHTAILCADPALLAAEQQTPAEQPGPADHPAPAEPDPAGPVPPAAPAAGAAGPAAPTGPMAPPGPAAWPGRVAVPPPSTLPYDIDDFTGRQEELDWFADLLERPDPAPRLIALDGMGGSGKTSLAVHLAHRIADGFRDGRIFIDLHGFTPGCDPLRPEAVLDVLLRSLGVSGDQVPEGLAERTAAWRTACANRRLLLVLDNVLDETQILPLIPSAPDCLAIVTSRRRLVNLDGAAQLSVGQLPVGEGVALVERIVGTERCAAEPEAVVDLVGLCGGLPLALRIAAARLRHRRQWTFGHLVGRLSVRPTGLDELSAGDRDVVESLKLSFLVLRPEQQRAFRLLGLNPGSDIDVGAAAALFGTSADEAERILESLIDVHLLEQPEFGRFSFHDLVRDFARSLTPAAAAPPGDAARFTALVDHYVAAAEAAADVLFPGRVRYPAEPVPAEPYVLPELTPQLALKWFGRERRNLVALLRAAADAGLYRQAAGLPRNLGAYLTLQEHPQELLEVSEISVAAARRLGDKLMLRLCLTNASLSHWLSGQGGRGITHLEEALDLAVEIGDEHGQAACLSRLGSFHNSLGRSQEALHYLRRALPILRGLADPREEAIALNGISSALNVLCRHDEAEKAAFTALKLGRRMNNLSDEALALLNLAEARLGLGEWELAVHRFQQAAAIYAQLRNATMVALVDAWRAYALQRAGHPGPALSLTERTLAVEVVSPMRRTAIANLLGTVLLREGQGQRAEQQYALARKDARSVENVYELALALDGLAAVARWSGRSSATAASYAAEAETLFARIGTPVCCRRQSPP